jgi:hypothetical protein
MDLIINCLCLLGMVWAASAVIGAFRRRQRPMGGGYPGYGYNNGPGWGGILGGLGLGWLLGNAWQQNQAEADYQEQLDTHQAYMEDSYGVENDWGSQDTGSDWDGGWGDDTWGGGGGGWGDSSD